MERNKQLCRKCGLYKNQEPIFDQQNSCDIFWVGLSAKKADKTYEGPLDPKTNTGKIITMIEEKLARVSTYKTNLVKCIPLTDTGKLRYPKEIEIKYCIGNLFSEISSKNPKIVFLLGEKVYSSIEKYLGLQFDKLEGYNFTYYEYKGIYFIPIQHPSYIWIYKRKEIDNYINNILSVINILLKSYK